MATTMLRLVVLCTGLGMVVALSGSVGAEDVPAAKQWPIRLHALLVMGFEETLSVMDLWYDWEKGGNLLIIQRQFQNAVYDMEWTNGTTFYYDKDAETCLISHPGIGILRPDWMSGGTYVGIRNKNGFTCNVWEKADFIVYYEEVETQRPVYWLFWNGIENHVITFEEGVRLQEETWQAPSYCFTGEQTNLSDTPLQQVKTAKPIKEFQEFMSSEARNAYS